jgi:hypothetical protein
VSASNSGGGSLLGFVWVPEMSVIFNQLAQLIAQRDFLLTLATIKALDLLSYSNSKFLEKISLQ